MLTIAEQLEVANTITVELAAQTMDDHDLAGRLALQLLPNIGKRDFIEVATEALGEITGAGADIAWLRPSSEERFGRLVDWVRVEITEMAN